MTADPRDLIEAPAWMRPFMEPDGKGRITGLHADYADDVAMFLSKYREDVAAARDEGRQEAVREIRAAAKKSGPYNHDWLLTILDEVARHGRSSDPEPAPENEPHPMEVYLAEEAARPGPTMTITKASYLFLLEQIRGWERRAAPNREGLTSVERSVLDEALAHIRHLIEYVDPSWRAAGVRDWLSELPRRVARLSSVEPTDPALQAAGEPLDVEHARWWLATDDGCTCTGCVELRARYTGALGAAGEPLDVERLANSISEAMNKVPWPGEYVTFGGLSFRAAARSIAVEYVRLGAGATGEGENPA